MGDGMWREESPTAQGWYWWREDAGADPEPVYVEQSGHKPPYWMSWGICDGMVCAECPNARAIDRNCSADGPIEEGYADGESVLRGLWWSVPIAGPGR